MTKRSLIRIISYIAFVIILIVATAILSTNNMKAYKNQLELTYQQSLLELSECLDNVNTDITKSIYSNSSGEIYDLSRDLYAQCSTAKDAMSRLPISQMEMNNAYKFLSQCSDYASYIGQKIDQGESITDEEHSNLLMLLKYAEQFSKQAKEMVSLVNSGVLITDNKVNTGGEINVSPLSNSFSTGAKTFEDFPTLLYDGPFSDQVLKRKSELVSNSEVMTRDACKYQIAKKLNMNINSISYDSDDKSTIPCYTFNYGRYTILITKQGGYIKEVIYSGLIKESNITPDNACNLAENMLEQMGYNNMEACYYTIENNICTINCAYSFEGVRYYSDLIKIGISMDNGELVNMDAKTYLTNHIEREKYEVVQTLEEAQSRVSPYLNIESSRLCTIPKESGKEVQCYEFTCKSNDTGENALVYINTSTGVEEDIMLLLYIDNGTMTK